MVRRSSIRCLAVLALACVVASASPAVPASLDRQLTAYRARAAKLAAARKWDLAIEAIGDARSEVRKARRDALLPAQRPAPKLEYQKAMRELRQWMVAQEKLVRAGKADGTKVAREFKTRRLALHRKFGSHPASNTAYRPRSTAETARLDLIMAALDDTAAGYFDGKGDPKEAAEHRRKALSTRLEAYETLGKPEQAAAAAGKLLKTAAGDPEAYEVVGQYFQERRQTARAVRTWEAGIRLLESGKARVHGAGAAQDRSRVRNRYLGRFYRQLAFCYSTLGRSADAKAALAKAAVAEQARR